MTGLAAALAIIAVGIAYGLAMYALGNGRR